MSPCSFKVIIVGGSIAGLSLAKMLEVAGIDFVVLEAYPSIAPQVGASIGLLGNGLRILDQLGCYDEIRKRAPDAFRSLSMRSSKGVLASHIGLDEMFFKRLAYPFMFMDRQTFLQVLYDHIKDKSKILTSKRVTEVHLIENRVTAVTEDGSEFIGDIIVGADGIHSTVRQEMWKLLGKYDPEFSPTTEWNRIRCSYACIFGISPPIGNLKGGDVVSVLSEHKSAFIAGGPGNRIYWFLFIGLRRTAFGGNVPRYTKEDEQRAAKEHSDLVINDEMSFGDLYVSKTSSSMTPIEECVFKKWHFGRIITIGDSAHKSNPINAQGGNSAVETAAALVNFLVKARESNPYLSDADIKGVFEQVQKLRQPRVETLVSMAHKRQSIEAMETPFLKFTALQIIPRIGKEIYFQRFYDTVSPGVKLKMLDVPKRPRQAPFEDELPKMPEKRGASMTAAAVIFFCLASIAWKFVHKESLQYEQVGTTSTATLANADGTLAQTMVGMFSNRFGLNSRASPLTLLLSGDPTQKLHLFYFMMMLAPYIAIWSVEGSRKKGSLPLIFSPLLWGFLYQNYGFGAITPLYYLITLYSSSKVRDFLPFGNLLPLTRAKATLPALLGFLIPTLLMLLPFSDPKVRYVTTAFWQPWPLYISILNGLFEWIFTIAGSSKSDDGAEYVGDELPYLKNIYRVTFIVSAVGHVGTVSVCLISPSLSLQKMFMGSGWKSSLSLVPEEEFFILSQRDMLIFFLASLLWLLMSVSELNRVGISTVAVDKAAILIALGSIVVGPGAMAAAVWYWRDLTIAGIANLM